MTVHSVVILQVPTAAPAWIQTPLEEVGFMLGAHYSLCTQVDMVLSKINADTKLLVLGADTHGSAAGLREIAEAARSLSPGIRVIGYSGCPLEDVGFDAFIPKDSLVNATYALVVEVAQIDDRIRNGDRAGVLFPHETDVAA